MDSVAESVNEEQNAKKKPFDELSRDELIKKCKGLLVIAQKAKQAKLDLQNENERYKNELEALENEKNADTKTIQTLQEFVDSLTEQKLNYTTEIDAARNKVQSLESSCKAYEDELGQMKALIIVKDTSIQSLKTELSDLDNEVVSLKRQNKRLVDENEHLLNQLSDLESKVLEFNEIGLQQREQLRILEENVIKDHTNDILENQVSVSKSLEEKVMYLENELASKESNNLEFQKVMQEYDQKLKEMTLQYENEKDKKEKANVKLRSYKDKILKCSACINQLKNTRFVLAKTVRDYSENIPKWQNDIIKASKILDGQIMELNKENKLLKAQLQNLDHQQTDLLNQNKLLTDEIHNLRSVSKNDSQNTDSKIGTMQLQIKALESEKATLVKEKSNARDQIVELENQIKILENDFTTLKTKYESVKLELDRLVHEKTDLEQRGRTNNWEEINELKLEVKRLKEHCELMKKENENLNDLNGLLKEEVATLQMSLEQPNNDAGNISDLNSSLQADIVKLETKLSAYKQENASLLTAMKESRAKLKNHESLLAESEELISKLTGYKTENAELLNEMKEINQVLKERGETISKQQKAIVEMERLIETLEKERSDMINNESDIRKRLASLEDDLAKLRQSKNDNDQLIEKITCERDDAAKNLVEKDFIISSLKDEIEKLRQHPMTPMELPNDDNMSTSTISKADEHARMKDLDDTFEEKYSKLRIFALKLKKRLNEATMQLKISEEDKTRLEKMLSDYMNSPSHESREQYEKICEKKIDNLETNEINSAVKDYERRIEELNMSLETVSSELKTVKAELASKELALAKELEEHKNTKDSLEKARRDVKKKNVLSLEMEDYERSMKDLTNKMEENKKKMVQMESTIDSQQGTISAMKTQLKLLEDQVKAEETQNRITKEELQHALEEVKEKDNLIQVKNEVISKLEQEYEDEKRNNEEQKIELATLLGEKEKIIIGLCEDKLELNNRLKKIEFKCADLEEMQKIRNIELEDLKTEYASYKVRAQAVLRQNQTIDHSQEEQLKEEMAVLKAEIESLTSTLTATERQCSEMRSLYESERRNASDAAAEAGRAVQRTARLQADLNRLTAQIDSERAHHKLQISTLTQCYKTQISELEAELQKEIEELKKQLVTNRDSHSKDESARDRSQRNNETYMLPIIPKDEGSDSEIDINVSMLPREEGEGSESAPSPPPSKPYLSGGNRSPVPLERLLEEGVPEDEIMDSVSLALTPEQELGDLRRKLQAQIQRVKHLTVLLAEAERDGARHAQMNELLKAEVRRARQALERTQHAHNAEYMKNVTLKFVTLPPGDERSRLVPVLQKILTLNSEETQRLNAVARGMDPNQNRGWGSYLPWGSPK